MIIKEFIKSGVIPDIYRTFIKSQPAAAIGKVAGSIYSPATFATKTTSNARVCSSSLDAISDIARYTKPQKVVPANIIELNKAATKCIEHLQGPNPKEYGVLIDEITGQVLQEGGGTTSVVSLNFSMAHTSINIKKARLAVLHGHTPIKTSAGEMTLPVSLQDFIVLNNTKLNKITALNSKSLHSTLEKNDTFVELSETDLNVLKNKYINELMNHSPIEKTERIKELVKYIKENPEALAHKRELANQLEALQYQEGADLIIDGFWKKYANSYGLKYTSDYNF